METETGMAPRRTTLPTIRAPFRLSAGDRRAVESVRRTGDRSARQVTRAHVLAALDDGVPDALIAAVLGLNRSTVWRIEATCRLSGIGVVLSEASRSGRPSRFPPEAADWVRRRFERFARTGQPPSIGQLQQAVRDEFGLDAISRETVRRWLRADRVSRSS